MQLSKTSLCITSYNSTGLGIASQNFISTLSLFSNIICLQEHFLLDSKSKTYSNTNKLRKLFGNKYDMFIVPASKDTSQVSRGRGKGGLATLWDKSLTKYVSQVKCSSFRLQATKFKFPSGSFLVINTYFPCDPRVNDFNEEELLHLLAEIKNIMNIQACRCNLVLGDLNSHFSRGSHFTTIIENFFRDINFIIYWENPDTDPDHFIHAVDYTHLQVHTGETFVSTIDHFASNDTLYNSVVEAGVFHSGDNPSNHSPIFAKVVLDLDMKVTESNHVRKRVNWRKSTVEARDIYTKTLDEKLTQLPIPECVSCKDVHCTIHRDQIEDYTVAILETVQTVAGESLSSSGGGRHGSSKPTAVPGWSEYVKPFSEESKFWFAVWQSAGRQSDGALYEAMMYSKRQYKHAVRRLKRVNNKIRNDKFVENLISGGVNIFSEIKKHRRIVKNHSSRIDDQVGDENIANRFADIYSDLYNQHETSAEVSDINDEVSALIGTWSIADADRITADMVMKALKILKTGKNDAMFDIQSGCLSLGPKSLVIYLTHLLRTFVIHGAIPYFLLICTLLPLVKDNLADITSSENYRAIATGSLLLKLLDILILLLEGDKLICDELQFGFQAGASTSMCTWTATTIIEHYNRQGRPVFACAMDLSKAFDLVESSSLFKLLLAKGLSPIFI